MNQRLAAVIEGLRNLSDERQTDIADILEAILAREEALPGWTAEQRAQVQAGLAEADQGIFAGEDEVSAVFARFRA